MIRVHRTSTGPPKPRRAARRCSAPHAVLLATVNAEQGSHLIKAFYRDWGAAEQSIKLPTSGSGAITPVLQSRETIIEKARGSTSGRRRERLPLPVSSRFQARDKGELSRRAPGANKSYGDPSQPRLQESLRYQVYCPAACRRTDLAASWRCWKRNCAARRRLHPGG